MVGGVKAHEVSLIVTHAPLPSSCAGVMCEHTTRSSFIHSFRMRSLLWSPPTWDAHIVGCLPKRVGSRCRQAISAAEFSFHWLGVLLARQNLSWRPSSLDRNASDT
jgi:hypothetical protein